MLGKSFPSVRTHRSWIITLTTLFVCYAAVILRTLGRSDIQPRLWVYLLLELICLVSFILMLRQPISWQSGQHIYFAFQTLLVLILVLLNPIFDFVAVLFVVLSFEAALVFPRLILFRWVAILILLTIIPLTAAQGWYGLALSLTPIAACIIFPAHVLVDNEIETGLRNSQYLLDELQDTNQKLTAFASQVEELSIIQEHDRLAQELHDRVSQNLQSILRINRTARLMLDRDVDQLGPQLAILQNLAQSSLEQMRSLISSLRLAEKEAAERLTPNS
ncbi:MAG: histidine kinase [Anaerolineaceae bacterium]|nr:histidine kinase [Anaerolineaceae bacterium]